MLLATVESKPLPLMVSWLPAKPLVGLSEVIRGGVAAGALERTKNGEISTAAPWTRPSLERTWAWKRTVRAPGMAQQSARTALVVKTPSFALTSPFAPLSDSCRSEEE